jgi:hypothetical protein
MEENQPETGKDTTEDTTKPDAKKHYWMLTIPRETFKDGSPSPYTRDKVIELLGTIKDVVVRGQAEIGEDGYKHWQIAVMREKSRIKWSQLKNAFPQGHLETVEDYAGKNSGRAAAVRYCQKVDTADKTEEKISIGELWFPLDTVSTTELLKEAHEEIFAGLKTVDEIIAEKPLLARSFAALDRMETARRNNFMKPFQGQTRQVRTVYLQGPTKAGKSTWVRSDCPNWAQELYTVSDGKNPWDKYQGQRAILFEEFRETLPLAEMLKILDQWPHQLSARYSNLWACWDTVYLTSNWLLGEQYQRDEKVLPADVRAFQGRIDEVIAIAPDHSYTVVDKPKQRIANEQLLMAA